MARRFRSEKEAFGHWAAHGRPRSPSSPLGRSDGADGPDEGERVVVGGCIGAACRDLGLGDLEAQTVRESLRRWASTADGHADRPLGPVYDRIVELLHASGVMSERPEPATLVRTECEDGRSTARVEIARQLPPGEVAQILQVSESTLRNWRRKGIGPPWQRVVGVIRYDELALRTWLAEPRSV